ncbi:hypothetical protein AAK873_13050 [Heminiphilus faecis]|uniref:Uncharacterized protein n=2 Tax=Muribaculaceae TaxID=2005473 RepID=A0AC61S689_9BACT|nr:hypothetical protein [Muribaculum caecicola]THG52361.1 hypothetical protein E5990_05255 [Muribaculum caecicola]
MKLTDKRFWKYEALSVLATAVTLIIISLHGTFGFDCIVSLWVLGIYLLGQMVAWKVVKRGSWLKLGLLIYLFSGIVFAFAFAVTIGIDNIVSDKRPEDVSPDTALWFSDFELYILFNIAWLIFSMIPAFLVSWITSVWLKLPQRPAGIKFTNNEKMNKEKLVSKLTSMGIENWEYSFNDITNWDCMVLYESGNEFQVIYVDDKGQQEIKAVFTTESDACDYILQLFKDQKKFKNTYGIN